METDLRYYIYSVSNILTVGVHLSSTPSISGPGSATGRAQRVIVQGNFKEHQVVIGSEEVPY